MTLTEDTSNDELIAQALAHQEAEDLARTAPVTSLAGTSPYPGHRRQDPRGPVADATIHTPSLPTPFWRRPRVPMCHVPCVLGNDSICMEMMVDTGAETSVMSWELARRLGLESSIDRSERGIASGVGQAVILGRVKGVICTLGHVEFPMDFAVLDVRQSLLILGMDQLRHYNCVIDLNKDVLVFGGADGVEVPLLPPDQQPNFDPYIDLRSACTIS
jgi:Aspartyl protease